MRPYFTCKTIFAAPLVAALLIASPGLLRAAQAQTTGSVSPAVRAHIEEVLNGLHNGVYVDQVEVSPDGKRIAWTQNLAQGLEILVAPLGDLAKSQVVTAGQTGESCSEGEVSWAPDSKAIAFLSDCAHPRRQADVYISDLNGKPARRLTRLTGFVQAPAFSPDGKEIAFLYVQGSMRPAGALAAQNPRVGVIGEGHEAVQRIAMTQADAPGPAAPTYISPAGLHVYEFDWSADSRSVAYVAANPPGEDHWWTARLYTQELGAAPRMILDPARVAGPLHGLQIAVPRWSPDGKSIAFIGGLMSDQGVTGGDVWMVPAKGGQPRDLTPGWHVTPAWVTWDGNGHLLMDEIAGGSCRLVRLTLHGSLSRGDLSARAGKPVFSFPGTIGDGRMELSLSATANRSLFVFAGTSLNLPMEIYTARPGQQASAAGGGLPGMTQISHFNDGVKRGWGRSVSVAWTDQGFHVQGWLTLPVDYNPAKKYALIVEVHGGPAAAVLGHWGAGGLLSPVAFSALGYFVLQPNPRGSFGQGEAFTEANRKDFGHGDLRDIVAGVTAVEAKYPIDPRRVGLTGWSYGGFMSMFATTQTQRFRAAVAGAGISDWLSYYGENSIDQWMIPYFGASVYDDPAVYAKSSAINFIKQEHTPTLVLVGQRDGECPAPQSFEFWHALRDLGVPTELVVYPNQGHGLADPADRHDVMVRAAEWFARYMPAGS